MTLKRFVIERDIPNVGASTDEDLSRRSHRLELRPGAARPASAVGTQLRRRRQDLLHLPRRRRGRHPQARRALRLPRHNDHPGQGSDRPNHGQLTVGDRPRRPADMGTRAEAACTVEEMVAALLKVDPEGITGQRSEKAKGDKDAKN